jgi:glycosyltransferase involved in cell wall biosynthesis
MSNNVRKPIIAMDLSTQGKGGGPFTSTNRIMSSNLKEKYDFVVIDYDPTIGRGISIKRIFELRSQLLKLKPDLVHFTGLSLVGFHIAVACFLARVDKKIVTIHGSTSDSIEFPFIKRMILTKIIEPLTLLISSEIVGVSDYVSNTKVPNMFQYKNFGTIYNLPPEGIQKENKISIQDLGFDEGDVIVTSVGRVNKEKGFHILEQAIKEFSCTTNVKFIIVGEGDYLKEMKNNLKEQYEAKQICFLGYRDDVQSINDISDIFVLPTLHETLSIALLEASASNLPLIGSNTGGVPEIIESGFNGELTEPGNSQSIAMAITKLVESPELRSIYGNNSSLKLKNKFSKKSIEAKLERLYSQSLSK